MSLERAIALEDLKVGAATQVELAGQQVCLVRTDADTVKAVHNICSHAHFELHDGWVDTDGPGHIECSLHGSSFDLETGRPDALPAVKPIPTYAVEVRDGEVLVDATTPTNDATPSQF